MTDTKTKLATLPCRHLRLRDRVIMQMDPDARAWGRKGPEDGTKGTVIGKYRATVYRKRRGCDLNSYEPGVYEEDGVPIIHWDGYDCDPTVVNGISRAGANLSKDDAPGYQGSLEDLENLIQFSRFSDFSIPLVDQDEVKLRLQNEWRTPVVEEKTISRHEQTVKLLNIQRIGDLPDTMAWEGDRITSDRPALAQMGQRHDGKPVHMRVHMINYKWVPHEPHTYMINWHFDETGEYAGMGSTYISDTDIKEVVRGNVWKHYNGQPLSFASLQEEVGFAHDMFMTEEMVNPKDNLYRWTKDEALQAIQDDYAHGFTMGGALMSPGQISLYRFKNNDLAQRVRQEVLQGFNMRRDR